MSSDEKLRSTKVPAPDGSQNTKTQAEPPQKAQPESTPSTGIDTKSDSRTEKAAAKKSEKQTERRPISAIHETQLEKMESLLSQSAMGIHLLFPRNDITTALTQPGGDQDLYNFDKMKIVQDIMTELVAKKTYLDKASYLHSLPQSDYYLLIKAYFHIVEGSIRAHQDYNH